MWLAVTFAAPTCVGCHDSKPCAAVAAGNARIGPWPGFGHVAPEELSLPWLLHPVLATPSGHES